MKDRLTLKQHIIDGTLMGMGYFERKRFEKSCRDTEAVQERVLLNLIERNSSSDFGGKHGFSAIKSVKDFQNALPVSDYEYFRPYVDRVIDGDVGALFGPGEKLLRFAITTGTTGKPKYIPVTKSFIKRYRKGWKLWGGYVLRDHPICFARKIMQSASPLEEEYTARGVPCGAISGLIAHMQMSVLRRNYALPLIMYRVKDVELKLYIGMRIAVPQNVGFFMTSNPSTILQYVRLADRRKEDIIKDVADGTCKGIEKLDDDVREALLPYVTKDTAQAKRLEGIVKETGHLHPKDYWPNLDLIACWTGGPVKIYEDRLSGFFGDTPVRDVGLIATEGRMTVPIYDGVRNGPLDIENGFFEFIPEESIEESAPPVLLPGELEVGKNYFILLTTWAGLYRYNISDVVEVTDFFHKNPIVGYLNKGKHFSNMMQEKISEYQVASAMQIVMRKLGLEIEDFCLVACPGDVPYYSIVIERGELKDDGMARQLMTEYDKTLRSLNISYNRNRGVKRIGPVSLRIIPEKSFRNHMRQLCKERGGRLEQLKHRYLINDNNLLKRFTVLEEKFIDD